MELIRQHKGAVVCGRSHCTWQWRRPSPSASRGESSGRGFRCDGGADSGRDHRQAAHRAGAAAREEAARQERAAAAARGPAAAREPPSSEQQRVAAEQRARDEAEQKERDRVAAEKAAEQRREREAQAERERVARERDAQAQREREAADKRAREQAEQRRSSAEADLQQQAALEAEAKLPRASSCTSARSKTRSGDVGIARCRRSPGIDCAVRVVQVADRRRAERRGGASCNGDDAVRRSIERAVFDASPLPRPLDPALFERNLNVTFRPEE